MFDTAGDRPREISHHPEEIGKSVCQTQIEKYEGKALEECLTYLIVC